MKINRRNVFNYPCESPVSCYPLDVLLKSGTYFIECYGASGGDSTNSKGGYGAYVSGMIRIKKLTRVYLFIGSKGHLLLGQPTFNGLGRAHIYSNTESQGASGGGSTDIRLINSSDQKGLLSLIIVAGAGGGAESYVNGVKGGNGMFYEGESGSQGVKQGNVNSIRLPLGGKLDKGGEARICLYQYGVCPTGFSGHQGGFGFGGNASDANYGAGGGSGYFGGGGAGYAGKIVASGAGGSSYVSGQKGCHSFVEGKDGNIVDANSEIHSSGLFFTNIKYKEGNETLHNENGKIFITYLQWNTNDITKRNFIVAVKCSLFILFIPILGNNCFHSQKT